MEHKIKDKRIADIITHEHGWYAQRMFFDVTTLTRLQNLARLVEYLEGDKTHEDELHEIILAIKNGY